MRIKKITRSDSMYISARLLELVGPLASEMGLTFSSGTVHASNSETGDVQLRFSCHGGLGEPQTAEKVLFQRLAPKYGLSPSDYGRDFRSGGHVYRICGLRPRASRYPVLVEGPRGRSNFPQEMVRQCLSAQ